MRGRQQRGQSAAEFALLGAVLGGALCLPWNGETPVVLQWFSAWVQWRESLLVWLANG